ATDRDRDAAKWPARQNLLPADGGQCAARETPCRQIPSPIAPPLCDWPTIREAAGTAYQTERIALFSSDRFASTEQTGQSSPWRPGAHRHHFGAQNGGRAVK